MVATTETALQVLGMCAEACEICAMRISSTTPDRQAAVYCRDCEQKCIDLQQALESHAPETETLADQCLHSAERCAGKVELYGYDFCVDCARQCRQVAELCRAA